MSRDDDMLGTFLVAGVGNLSVTTPAGQEAVVDSVNVASVTGGAISLVLSGSRTIALGPVAANSRANLIFPDASFVGAPAYTVGLTVPADGIGYIAGYYRHQRV